MARRRRFYGASGPRLWVRIRGAWRLKLKVCPACMSSPPLPGCAICNGSYDYSNKSEPAVLEEWKQRWNSYIKTGNWPERS